MMLQQTLKGLQYSPSPISHSNDFSIYCGLIYLLQNYFLCFALNGGEYLRLYCYHTSIVFIFTLLPFNYFELTMVVTTILFFLEETVILCLHP